MANPTTVYSPATPHPSLADQGYKFTGAGAAEQQRQAERAKWLQAFGGRVDAWEQSRQPYQQDIYNRTFAAGRQQADIAAQDALRQNQYEMARRGTRQSSIDSSLRGRIGAAHAGALAQVSDQATAMSDAQRRADMEAAQAFRLMAQQYRPGEDFQAGVDLRALDDQARFVELLARAAEMAYGGRMSNEQLQGQVYGSMIGTAGAGAQQGGSALASNYGGGYGG